MPLKNEIKVSLSADIGRLRRGLNDGTAKIKLFGRSIKESLTTFGGQNLSAIETGFSAIGVAAGAAAAGGIYLFTRAMSSAIDTAIRGQNLSKAFLAIQGGSELAAEEMKFVREEAYRLGLEFYSAADAYKNILAASKGAAAEGETTRKIFSAISEASSALGLSAEDTQGALLAISQMMSKGKVSAEELRGQLGERLPGAFNLMAQSLGVSTAQLDSMLQKGQVGVDVLGKFADTIHAKYGAAAQDTDTYQKAMQQLKNEYGFLKEALGAFIVNNTFVIESMKVVRGIFEGFQKDLGGSREQMVSLVKDGVLLFIDGIGASIETMRFFYNGWQGLSLIAHGAVVVIVKGLEMVVGALRVVLKPLDLFLTGLEKIGIIDSNPLKNLEETLQGFGKFSLDEFNLMLDRVSDTNAKFDQAKAVVEQFKQKIAAIPAEYKDATDSMESDTKKVEKEIKLVDGVWTEVAKESGKEWSSMADGMIKDIERVKHAARRVTIGADGKTESTEYSSTGFARGGDPFWGGLRGYGGGDRRLIWVEDGEHVIRKEAVRRLGHGFFQQFNNLAFPRIPKFATGGAVGGGASRLSSPINITINYSGGGSRSDAKQIASMVMTELQRQYRRSSR